MTKPDGSPVEVARTWLLSALDGGGWTEAEAIEAAREAAGVSARALTTARGRLVRDGRVEKRKAGRGAWSYRLVGRVPESEPAPESESEAAPGHEAEPAAESAARPEAGASPAVPEVPKRFAATLRLLADPPPALAVDAPEAWAVLHALKALAADCGYTLEKETWQSSYNPKLIILKLHPRSPVSGP